MAIKSIPTFHDSRYLFAGLLAFAGDEESIPTDDLERRIRKAIQDYVAEQQRKYLLAEHNAIYEKIPYYIIGELSSYGLLEKIKDNGKAFRITSQGKSLLDLLVKHQALQVRTKLAAYFVFTFPNAKYFLERLWKLPDHGGLRLPEITYITLEPLKRYGAVKLLSSLQIISQEITKIYSGFESIEFSAEDFVSKCQHELQGHDWQREPKRKSFQAMRRVVDEYMLNIIFPGQEISRPKYDVLRNRSDTFGLVNQRRIEGSNMTWGHTYLTGWLIPQMQIPQEIPSENLLTASVDGVTLYIHEPRWEIIREQFIKVLRDAYSRLKMNVGYARVVDVRDDVCFRLKLASRTFDFIIKRLSEEDKSFLAFSIAPERYTPKNLPLYLSEGRTYNLIRVL